MSHWEVDSDIQRMAADLENLAVDHSGSLYLCVGDCDEVIENLAHGIDPDLPENVMERYDSKMSLRRVYLSYLGECMLYLHTYPDTAGQADRLATRIDVALEAELSAI